VHASVSIVLFVSI